MYRNSSLKWITSLIFLMATGIPAAAQYVPKLSIAGGFGVPELFHAGLKLQASPRSEWGIYYGFIHSSAHQSTGWFKNFEINFRSVTADHSYSFGNISPLSQRHVWYARQGINYYHEVEGADDIFSCIFTIGRTFSFGNASGLNLDLGTAIPFSGATNIIPAGRLQFYILLGKPPQ